MKTYWPKPSEIESRWHLLDAKGEVLGRLATRVAVLLKGKHKPTYAPNLNLGDHVVVINAEQVQVTGRKLEKKIYYHHTQHPGGLRQVQLMKVLQEHPIRVIEHAVRGMLPHNALGRAMFRHLKVYAGAAHPHAGQVQGTGPKAPVEQAAMVTSANSEG